MSRPPRYDKCPECGIGTPVVTSTEKRGHVTSRWCTCSWCGVRLRYVSANDHEWYLVRDGTRNKSRQKPI